MFDSTCVMTLGIKITMEIMCLKHRVKQNSQGLLEKLKLPEQHQQMRTMHFTKKLFTSKMRFHIKLLNLEMT